MLNKDILLKAKNNFDFFETPSHHAEYILKDCYNNAPLNVLDICCGCCSLSHLFYITNCKITLIELNKDFIPHLKKQYPKANILNDDFLNLQLEPI